MIYYQKYDIINSTKGIYVMQNLSFKLDRTIWIALLNQNKIIEGCEYFQKYIHELNKHKRRSEIKDEIKNSKKLFYTTLYKLNEQYIKNEDYPNALISSNILFKIDNLHINAIKNYITALAKTNQKDLCKDMIEYLNKITNNDVENYKFIAEIYNVLKEFSLSIDFMEKYIESKNDKSSNDYNLLGCYYSNQNNNEYNETAIRNAIKYFLQAHKQTPNNRLYIENLCIMYPLINDYSNTRKYYDKLLQLGRFTNDNSFEYSAFCLKMGEFQEYYNYSDSRFKYSRAPYFPKLKGKKWDCKTDISDSTLLVHWEQGFGDTILGIGFIDKLKTFAKNIILVVQNDLFPLLQNNNSGIEVIQDRSFDENTIKYDYYIPILDVLKVLNITKEIANCKTNFINTNSTNYLKTKEKFKNKYFNNDKLKIGISLFGNNIGNKTRDIPIEKFILLKEIPNTEFYILNKDFPINNIPEADRTNITNIGVIFENFNDTACAIENCDIIISCDNCILNLAGILNKKTYGIFNWVYEYRWYDLTGEDTGWYKSVKPYINNKMNNWEPTLKKVVSEICEMTK